MIRLFLQESLVIIGLIILLRSNIAIAGKDKSIIKAKDDIFGSKLYDVVAFNKKSF